MISDEEMSRFIQVGKNGNTVGKTPNNLTRHRTWRMKNMEESDPEPIETIEPSRLNKILISFFFKRFSQRLAIHNKTILYDWFVISLLTH